MRLLLLGPMTIFWHGRCRRLGWTAGFVGKELASGESCGLVTQKQKDKIQHSYDHHYSLCQLKSKDNHYCSLTDLLSISSSCLCKTNVGAHPKVLMAYAIRMSIFHAHSAIGHFTVVCLVTWPGMQARLEVTLL